jgi:hypothetical protein
MRCPSCGTFVPYDEPEAEEQAHELSQGPDDGTAEISADIRLVLRCGNCGSEELKEETFTFEETVEIPEEHQGEGHELELEIDDPEGTSRTQTHDRHGKPIKRARYARTYYGVEATWTVGCSCGEQIASGTFSDDVQASGMSELA